MGRMLDLSHEMYPGMPAFTLRRPDGTSQRLDFSVRPFLSHAESGPYYQGLASFEISEVTFQTSLGTYLDSPSHRHPGREDIADLSLERLALPGVAIDCRHCGPERPANPADLSPGLDLAGKAVLIHFGWDRFWGVDDYYRYPFLDRDALQDLLARGAALVGVDTLNIDSPADPARPAHTWLLDRGTLIVENLTNLGELVGRDFRFLALPIRARGAAAFPVRAVAELN